MAKRKSVAPSPEVQPPKFSLRWEFIFGLLVFITSLFTMGSSVVGGDSGELITVAARLGVAHPPGYPLYTIVGHLFSLLPLGSLAWKLNLFSAVTGAVGGALLFHLLRLWTGNIWIALLTAGIFCWSPLVWRYNVVAEVFSLHTLFVLLLLFWSWRWFENRRAQDFDWLCLTIGLSVSHHHTVIFVLLPLTAFLLVQTGRDILRPSLLTRGLALMFLGLTPYLYLLWAPHSLDLISWGETHTWAGFWKHFFRREYGTFQLASSIIGSREVVFFKSIASYAYNALVQLLWICWPLAAFGVFHTYKKMPSSRSRTWHLWISCTFLFYVLGFHFLANLDLSNPVLHWTYSRFWIVPHLFLVLLAAQGLRALPLEKLPRSAIASVASLLLAIQLCLGWTSEDQTRNSVVEGYARDLLNGVPEGALLLTRGDLQSNPSRYLQIAENLRPDVMVVDRALLTKPWYKALLNKNYSQLVVPGKFYRPGSPGGFDLRTLVSSNTSQMRVFTTDFDERSAYESKDKSLHDHHVLWPVGYANELIPRSQFRLETALSQSLEGLKKLTKVHAPDIRHHEAWEGLVHEFYWQTRLRLAHRLLQIEKQGILTSPQDQARAISSAVEQLSELSRAVPGLFAITDQLMVIANRRAKDLGLRLPAASP